MASPPDAAKVAAFNAFDWSKDERWRSHLNAIELPSSDSSAQLTKVKARWFKRVVDSSFEAEWVTSAAAKPASAASPKPSTSRYPGSANYERPAASAPPPEPTPQAPPPSYGPPRMDPGKPLTKMHEMMLFGAHMMLLVLAFLHLIPLLSAQGLSGRAAYLWFMRLTIITQASKIVAKHAAPPLFPFSWDKIKAWLANVLPSTEFFQAMVAFSFSSYSPVAPLMWPIAVPAAYHAITFAAKTFGATPGWRATGGRLQSLMTNKQRDATLSCAAAEILVGFTMIFRLLTPQRNILLTFFFWNMLKMRYLQSDMMTYHREMWSLLDQKTISYRMRVPIVEKGLGYIMMWFLKVD